jgi:hypothetical protein
VVPFMRKATCSRTIARVSEQSCVVVDPSARLETSYTRTGRPRWRLSAQHYGEILERRFQDLPHRLRSERQDCG